MAASCSDQDEATTPKPRMSCSYPATPQEGGPRPRGDLRRPAHGAELHCQLRQRLRGGGAIRRARRSATSSRRSAWKRRVAGFFGLEAPVVFRVTPWFIHGLSMFIHVYPCLFREGITMGFRNPRTRKGPYKYMGPPTLKRRQPIRVP